MDFAEKPMVTMMDVGKTGYRAVAGQTQQDA